MVRLNKNQLSESQLESLFTQMSGLFGPLNARQSNKVFSELLGQEEKIMLAKRLAILILLLEGKSLYNISELLKVSATTAEKIKRGLLAHEFDVLVETLGKNKQSYFSMLEALDSILHLGGILPHYNGIDRFKRLK